MKKILTLVSALFFALGMMAAEILSTNFTQGQGDWTINNVNLDGLSYVWQQSSSYGMKATAYVGGTNHATESWLVSPVFDLSNATSATLNFSHARRYGNTSDLHVIATTNPDYGWMDLSVSAWPDGNSWTFINATVDLSYFVGYSNVQVAFAYTSTTSGAATWEIKTASVTAEVQGPVYYLAGTMNNWGPAAGYQFMENPNVSGEYMLDVTLHAYDELKVIEVINGVITTWYPDGINNNFIVSQTGNYTIYFRPDGELYDGYYGYYFLEKKIYPRYDVADAIAAGLQENTEIEVRGVITKMEIKGSNFAKFGSVNIYVADANGAEGEFEFYNCYSLDADTFKTTDPAYSADSTSWMQITSITDASGRTVNVGDTVVAFGKYQLYNSIHELKTGCYLVDVQPAAQTIALDYAYSEAYYYSDYSDWLIYAYNLDASYNVESPYLYFYVSAKSATAISGTYSGNEVLFVAINDGNSDIVTATQVSDIVITALSQGYYRYQFSFVGSDGNNYVVDIMPSVEAYNGDTYEQIMLNEDPTEYYLAGTMTDWYLYDDFRFEANPAVYGEYMLTTTLTAGDSLQIVGYLDGVFTTYPSTPYIVDAQHAGAKTIYFRPAGNDDWTSVHPDGYFWIDPNAVEPEDIYVNVTSGLALFDYTADDNVWQLLKADEVSITALASQISGTYAVSDLYYEYSWVINNGERIYFADGSITVTESMGAVYVSGTLTGEDGNYYHIYLQYTTPVAETVVTLNIPNAESYDKYLVSDSLFQVYGDADESSFVTLGIWSATKAGTYTEDDLYSSWSYLYINNEYVYIYNANITIIENIDGTFTLTASLLCYNNTQYNVTMLLPAPPVAETVVTLNIPEAEFYDEYFASYGLFQVYGWSIDSIGVTLGIWSDTKPGTYTEADLNEDWSYLYINGEEVYIYNADITIIENVDGSYTVNAILLCYNNTQYNVTMTVPAFEPEDIYVTITSDVRYTDNTATYGWWEIWNRNDNYFIILSNLSSEQAPGTYTVDQLDPNYTYIAYATGDTIRFVDGSVTLSENASGVIVSGTLTGNDGNYYHIYIEYIAPVAETVVSLNVPEASFYDDYWTSNGLFQVYGWANDTSLVALGIWSTTKAGTYTEADLNYNWSYVYLNGERVYVYDADITLVENADGSYNVTASLLCYNNTLYNVTMYVAAPPVAETTVVANVPNAVMDKSYWATDGIYYVYGMANDSLGFMLGIWRTTTIQGSFTEYNLSSNDSYIYNNESAIGIYSANFTVTANVDGSYSVNASLLAYNNTLYIVTMFVPAPEVTPDYYLVGTMNGWLPTEGYLFAENPANFGEYILNVTLAEGDELKVVEVIDNEIIGWYPGGINNNFIVSDNYAGDKVVYFRPTGNAEWESFHQGGFFYIEPNNPDTTVDPTPTVVLDMRYADLTYNAAEKAWEFNFYKESYPDFYITLAAKDSQAIAGAYAGNEIMFVELKLTENRTVHATEMSEMTIACVKEHIYHYTFSFLGNDNVKYILDVTLGTEAYDKETGDLIELTDQEGDGLINTFVSDKVEKILRDGQILIIKGDKTYNMSGQIVR